MIASVIKTQFGTVVVVDKTGRKISRYCRVYEEVKAAVLNTAPPEAEFYHEDANGVVSPVPRASW